MLKKVIMTSDDIRRTLARIAHQIIEQNKTIDNLILVGMHTRGVPIAKRLATNIEHFEKVTIPVGALDISLYRDDIYSVQPKPAIKQTNMPANIDGRSIILVDDVLYTGRSIRAAMDALIDLGRPQSIQLVVFIDRGHREMPIRADYVGKNIPSSREEEIQVHLTETDGVDEVVITQANENKDTVSPKRSNHGSG